MNSCPICQKPVDPLRATHVRVVGIRVIPYCSAACRDAAAGQPAPSPSPAVAAPAAAVSAPAAAMPAAAAKSGAVVTPAAAPAAAPSKDVAKSAKEAAKEAAKDAKEAAKAKTGKEPALSPVAKVDDKAKAAADAAARAAADAAAAKIAAKPADAKLGAKADAKTDGKAAADAAAKADAKVDAKTDGKADAKSGAKPGQGAASESAKPASAATSKPASAVEAAASVRNADEERDATVVPPEPRSSRGLIIAVLVLAVAGVGIWAATRGSSEPAPPPPAPPQKLTVVIDAAPPPIDPDFANRRAIDVLREHLAADITVRVQRAAAAALSRLKDPQAIEILMEIFKKEQSDLAKLEIAYAMARAGDKRGLEYLANGLRSSRRDVKADAARLLAALGDARAESTLTSLMSLSQSRLSAAEQLARLGNKQALVILNRIRADKPKPAEPPTGETLSPEAAAAAALAADAARERDAAKQADRLRATVALGYAGQQDVAEELRALLTDTGFNVGAAGALAMLGDPAARPVLVQQLKTSSLRVSAALSLRRLEPTLDAVPLLPELMAALESEKDTERINVAETVLLLTGPTSLAERD